MCKALTTMIWLGEARWNPNVKAMERKCSQRVSDFHLSGDSLSRPQRSAEDRPQGLLLTVPDREEL